MESAGGILEDAVLRNHLQTVEWFLLRGAAANAVYATGESALTLAAAADAIGMCELLLHFGADVNLTNHYNQNALHCAAWKRNASICALLLDECAVMVEQDMTYNTPLSHAADSRHTSACQELVAFGSPMPVYLRLSKVFAEEQTYLVAIRDASWSRRLPAFAAYVATHGVWWK